MGRTIPSEHQLSYGPFASPSFVRRREVLRETIAAFTAAAPDHYHRLARANLARWRQAAAPTGPKVQVTRGDWGEVCARETREHGRIFAALNMANAYIPGGGYVEGSPAQEENMFRRSDCHFALSPAELDPTTERYRPAISALINARGGRVLLDVDRVRVCVRGPEDRAREDLGYAWLPDDEVFPFYELRAAAVDLSDGRRFDPAAARARIDAQLDTLLDAGVRHVVLSAFGCGAFLNPADEVARIYRAALDGRANGFERVVFAIFDPGYGPDNYTPFARAFER